MRVKISIAGQDTLNHYTITNFQDEYVCADETFPASVEFVICHLNEAFPVSIVVLEDHKLFIRNRHSAITIAPEEFEHCSITETMPSIPASEEFRWPEFREVCLRFEKPEGVGSSGSSTVDAQGSSCYRKPRDFFSISFISDAMFLWFLKRVIWEKKGVKESFLEVHAPKDGSPKEK